MPLRIKVALIFILAGWSLAALTSWLYYSLIHRVASEITKEYFATVIGLKQKEITSFVDIAQNQLIEISHQEIGQFDPATLSPDKPHPLKAELSDQLPYILFGELAIVDATGSALLTTKPSDNYHYADSDGDTTFKPRLVNHDHFSHNSQENTIEFRTPITSYTRLELIGHISIEKIQFLFKYFAQSQDKLRFYLTDGKTTISDNSVHPVNPQHEQSLITKCLSEKPSSALITTTTAAVWIPELNSCLSVIDSLQKETQFNQAFRNIIGVALAIIALCIFTVVWIVTSRFGKSLEQLVRMTKKIAAGDVDQTIPSTSIKELDTIAASLRHICQQMKQSKQELEDKIADRTQNLNIKIDQLEELIELTANSEMNAEKMRKERDELLVQLQQLRDKREKS